MSSASKSKSKDKKMVKEPVKASVKLAGSSNGSGIPLSAYNPVLVSFHALELETSSSAASNQASGRFQGMDEYDINIHYVGTGGEFDAISNNGSWSGESEGHKEKLTNQPIRQESVPGTENDKREKIRQKNERKHQRQKERRNLELHEKCGGYLMSRKLEYLSQQLVAMGFSAERSTMALILNEGKVDQSVAWLIDEGADDKLERDSQTDQKFAASGNLKIDISEELARIAELEIKYKCSRQEVERSVVACEGDIDKACETLKSQKDEPPVPPKPEETGDPPTLVTNGSKHSSIINPYSAKAPPRPNSATSITSEVRDEKDFNYTKTVSTAGMLPDNSNNGVQVQQKRVPPQADWSKSQQIVSPVAEKRWPVLGTSSQVTSPVASPLQVSPRLPNAGVRYTIPGVESRNIQQIGVREPVTVMQRQQPHTSKPFVVTSIATSTHTTMPSWHPIGGSDFVGNGVAAQMSSSRSFNTNKISPNQLYQQQQQQQQQQLMYQHQLQALTGSNPMDTISHAKTSSSLTPASSLGLFPGTIASNIPSSGSSSPNDWLNGFEMRQIDYANIDWSLNRNTLPHISPPPMESSPWSGNGNGNGTSPSNGIHLVESRNGVAVPRPSSSNGRRNNGGVGIPTRIGGVGEVALNSSMGMHDWSSPFEENDIFSLPIQFASLHSMYENHRDV